MAVALADAIVVIHLGIVLFVVGGEAAIVAGGLLKWAFVRNAAFRITHLAVILFVTAETLAGLLCPLTVWEQRLRHLAGQAVESDLSFMARLVRAIIFYDLPGWVFTVAYIVFCGLVVATLRLVPPRFSRKRAGAGQEK